MQYMMFIYTTAKFVPVWTSILKIRAICVQQTLTKHALCQEPVHKITELHSLFQLPLPAIEIPSIWLADRRIF